MSQTPRSVPYNALEQGPCPSFPRLAGRYLTEYADKIRFALAALDEEQIWWRPHGHTNAIGNLLLHLAGNLSMWLLAGIGGEDFQRDRGGEFAATGGASKDELLARLGEVVERSRRVVEGVDEGDLGRPCPVQTYDSDVLGVVFHAVEHMAYHTGQIVWIAKQLRDRSEPLEFYPRHQGE